MKRTLIVLLLLAGLGAYVYVVEIKGKAKEEASEKKAKKIFTVHEFDITRVEIDNEFGKTIVAKSGEKWHMESPVSAPADESSINALLASISSAETKEAVEGVADMAFYGLNPPKITLTVTAGDKRESVKIGKRSPVSQDLYVLRDSDGKVYQTSGGLDGSPGKKSDEFREKRLFTFEAEAVTGVTIKQGSQELVLKRTGDQWQILKPVALKAEASLATTLAGDLASIRATHWLVENAAPADLQKYELNKSVTTIEAELTDGKRQTLILGPVRGNDRIARVAGKGQIVNVADWSAKQLLKTVEDLRDRNLISIRSEDINRMSFRTSDVRLVTFKREGGGWSVSGNASGMADGEKVQELIDTIVGLRAEEWKTTDKETLKAHELLPPLRVVDLYDASGKLRGTIRLGKEENESLMWAQTDDPRVEAKVTSDFVKNKWPNDIKAFFSAPVSDAGSSSSEK